MKNIDILIHVLTLFSGLATALLGFLLFLKYRIKTIGYYTLFILTTTFTVAMTTVYSYYSFYRNKDFYSLIEMIPFLLFEVFIMLINYTFTLFAMGIIGRPFNLKNKISAFLPAVFIVLSIVILVLSGSINHGIKIPQVVNLLFMMILLSLFFTFISYSILIALNLKNIENPDLKKALKVMAILFMIFIPVQILIVVFIKRPMIVFLSRNIFYFTVNVTSIVFAARYFFIETPSIMERIEVSPVFIRKYSITAREKEIIEYILSGLSIKETSGRIGRSFKTVNNHIHNIYSKTGAGNKMELLNLVRENSLSK